MLNVAHLFFAYKSKVSDIYRNWGFWNITWYLCTFVHKYHIVMYKNAQNAIFRRKNNILGIFVHLYISTILLCTKNAQNAIFRILGIFVRNNMVFM